jgi:hypothetical protein
MRYVILVLFLLLIATVLSFGQQLPFSASNIALPKLGYSACAWGDYDRDGDLDLALSGVEGNAPATKILRNDNGIFTSIGAGTALHFGSLEWGDADLDGDLDLLATGIDILGVPYTRIMINMDGSFAVGGISLTGIMDGQACFGDVNNDGSPDVLLAGGNLSQINQNDGTGIYDTLSTGLPDVEAAMCSWVDYNNDGQSDVMVCGNTGGGMISKLFKNDHGVFTEVTITPEPFTGLYGGQVKWADLDNDGDRDLVIAGTDLYVDGHFIFYRNDGNGHFTKFEFPEASLLNPFFDLADYNADGLMDVALIGTTPGCGGPAVTLLLKNNGSFNFNIVSTLIPGYKLGGVAWGDYNNDGYSDLVLTGLDGFDVPQTALYLNNLGDTACFSQNTPPSPPLEIAVSMESDKAVLKWSRASDVQTAQNALTYNIRIGTLSDSFEILSPLSMLYTGLRTIASPGNAGADTSWIITGIPEGTYYFSVQAIDNGLMAGSFSTPYMFSYMPVGIDPVEKPAFSIFPNPSHDKIFFQDPEPANPDYRMKVVDETGKCFYEGSPLEMIDISSWPNGIYLIQKTDRLKTLSAKFIKN